MFSVQSCKNLPEVAALIWESVEIQGSKATIILNSNAEWHQPVVEPPEQQGGGRRGKRQGWGAKLFQLGK